MENPEPKHFQITFYILESHRDQYFACRKKIEILQQQSKPVPAKLVKDLGNCFYPKEYNEYIKKQCELQQVASQTIRHFAAKKGFSFKGKTKDKLIFDFTELIDTILHSYYRSTWYISQSGKVDDRGKDDIIAFFYISIAAFTEHFDKKEPLISHYKKVIIAIFITEALGFKIINIKNPTNRQLYDAGKNAVEKIISTNDWFKHYK